MISGLPSPSRSATAGEAYQPERHQVVRQPPFCHLSTGAPNVCGLARTSTDAPSRHSIQHSSKARTIKQRMTAIVGMARALVNRLIALWRRMTHSPLSPYIHCGLVYLFHVTEEPYIC